MGIRRMRILSNRTEGKIWCLTTCAAPRSIGIISDTHTSGTKSIIHTMQRHVATNCVDSSHWFGGWRGSYICTWNDHHHRVGAAISTSGLITATAPEAALQHRVGHEHVLCVCHRRMNTLDLLSQMEMPLKSKSQCLAAVSTATQEQSKPRYISQNSQRPNSAVYGIWISIGIETISIHMYISRASHAAARPCFGRLSSHTV